MRTMSILALVFISWQAALAQPNFWRPGNVHELFFSGLPNKLADLKDWAAHGVNSVLGVSPADAHQAGMKARTWFTMDYMDSRHMSMAEIEKMAARNQKGGLLRPFDPLFPTVGQYGYSACVNNPAWQQHAIAAFRQAAQAGYDGVHVDFASHYENCFCPYCQQQWRKFAAQQGLGGLSLDQAAASSDFRVRALLREFRIRSVMNFLGMCRAAAREINPTYALDGTYHQDSGSTFQWQYGDHYDLMCIEGTTWGPFPPAGEQIVWLKVAAGLSRGKVPMSVTYHMIRDKNGQYHHGRMAGDRLAVALGEIMSQGAVSWLGLGGPHTGNLLREHQPLVKDYYKFFADNEDVIAGAKPRAQVALLFSPRSYLVDGSVRTAAYVIGEALMKAHVPFVVVGDYDLTARSLAAYQAVVALPAPVLSDATIQALDDYVNNGGGLLWAGDQGKYDEQYRPRATAPRYVAVTAKAAGDPAVASLGRGTVVTWKTNPFSSVSLGAAQNVTVNQQQPAPLAIEGYSRADNVSGQPDSNYSLYVDITYQDGTPLWGQTAQFKTGSHDWEFSRFIIQPKQPVKSATVHLLFRGHHGTVWFREVKFGPWDARTGKITKNLLSGKMLPASGKVYDAEAGQQAQQGAWGPYANGFEVVTVAGRPVIECAAAGGLTPGIFNEPDSGNVKTIMTALGKLLQGRREITVQAARGAQNVYADLTDSPHLTAVQLINYNAVLHPTLPDLEQEKQDQTTPVDNLTITVRLPQGRAPAAAELREPGRQPVKLSVRPTATGAAVTLPRLDEYAMIVLRR